jgi:hypothetical protein
MNHHIRRGEHDLARLQLVEIEEGELQRPADAGVLPLGHPVPGHGEQCALGFQAAQVISNLVDRGIAKRQTASAYLKELVRIGVLEEKQAGKERLFINPRLLLLLTRETNQSAPYTA